MFRWLILIVFFAQPFLAAGSCAQETKTQFVLLKNGQMIEGTVSNQPEKITVGKPSGSQIVFAKNMVVAVSTSKSEIYWQKCAQLSSTDVSNHISLFRWCLKNELTEEAHNQIDLIQGMMVSPSRLLELSNHLDATKSSITQRKHDEMFAIAELPSLDPAAPVDQSNSESVIRQVGFYAPLDHVERAKFIEKIESTTDDLPDYAVVMFKRKIEPLLIHSCYTAKCHDGNSEPFPLHKATIGQTTSKRMSQRNLYNILRFTNFQRPLESKILAAAALAHAGQDKPILKINSKQFQNLRLWLIAISEKPLVYHPIPSSFLKSDLAVTKTAGDKTEDDSDDQFEVARNVPEKAPVLKSAAEIPKTKPKTRNGSATTVDATKSDVSDSSTADEDEQKDPFDPTFFNKNLRKRK